MFGRTPSGQGSSHQEYVRKWRKRLDKAYQPASKSAQAEGNRGKALYDRKIHGAELEPGCRVLIRNMNERGGPGKLRSYWEERAHIVREKKLDCPVYEVQPENSQGRIGILHRNLLLPCNFLPLEEQPPEKPEKPGVKKRKGQKWKSLIRELESSSDDEEV